jgi:hypothetical protein
MSAPTDSPLPDDWEQQDSIRGYALYLRLRRKRLRPGRRKPARAIEVTLPDAFKPRGQGCGE